jgi:hypothetical protein
MRSLMRPLLLLGVSLLAIPEPADAVRLGIVFSSAAVGFAPELSQVAVGEAFDVEIRADFSLAPVLGFGLDVSFDPAILAFESPPEIAAPWLPVFAPDGDGLAGVAFDAGLLGDDLLLAVLHLRALGPGSSALVLSATPDDLTEGFALDPEGFALAPIFGAGGVQVVPEPGPGLLVAAGLAALALGRRCLPRRFS